MNAIEERSVSLWMGTASVPAAKPLEADDDTDVVIVGAGIAGLSTAYELAKLGRSVIVLDRGELGGGMTSRTSAHLNSNIDDLFQELIRLRGEEEARLYLKARLAAIDRIEEIQASEEIACDFSRVDGYLFPAKSDDVKTLEGEFEACRKVGVPGVKWVDQTPIPDAGAGRSLLFPDRRDSIRGSTSRASSARSSAMAESSSRRQPSPVSRKAATRCMSKRSAGRAFAHAPR
jgi:hypothetical protein